MQLLTNTSLSHHKRRTINENLFIIIMKEQFFTLCILSILTFTVVSCSESDSEDQMTLIEENHTPNPMDAYVPLASDDASSMKSVLGYGLDIMGEIGSYQSVKAQIIDLDRMDSEDPYSAVKVGTFQSFSDRKSVV